MSAYDHGPLIAFEVVWASGHVETVWAHQCTLPMATFFSATIEEPRRIAFHGEVDGRWQLILAAPESDIRTVRNLTATEVQ